MITQICEKYLVVAWLAWLGCTGLVVLFQPSWQWSWETGVMKRENCIENGAGCLMNFSWSGNVSAFSLGTQANKVEPWSDFWEWLLRFVKTVSKQLCKDPSKGGICKNLWTNNCIICIFTNNNIWPNISYILYSNRKMQSSFQGLGWKHIVNKRWDQRFESGCFDALSGSQYSLIGTRRWHSVKGLALQSRFNLL